jgi:F-type H+-transporting ATPase subunit delta
VEANSFSVRLPEYGGPSVIAKRVVFLVSGGFAIVQPNSVLSINAVEGFPLEDFSAEAVRSQLAEAQKIAAGSGSEQDIAEAKIELEVST